VFPSWSAEGPLVHALDALSGESVWRTKLPALGYSKTAVLHGDTLYVSISSGEESHFRALDPRYECCKQRGAIFAAHDLGVGAHFGQDVARVVGRGVTFAFVEGALACG
jgi:hypothetical protein